MSGYEFILRHIIPELGHIQLQKLTPKQVQSFYKQKLEEKDEDGCQKLSSNTVKKYHTLLTTAFNFAVKQDVLKVNLMDKVIPPKDI